MCNHMERACYSQEGVVEFGCDCVRLSVPTHPDSGLRLEQTGAVLHHHRGQATATQLSHPQCGGGENHQNHFAFPL